MALSMSWFNKSQMIEAEGRADVCALRGQAASHAGDGENAEISNPAVDYVAKGKNEGFAIPEFAPPHAGGAEIERCGNQVWKFFWKDGRIERTEWIDPT